MSELIFKRPESVLVLVYSRDNNVLLLNRCDPADYWQSVTGSLEWGESAPAAAQRELFEETGLIAGKPSELIDLAQTNCFPILPAWQACYDPAIDHNVEHVFAIRLEAEIAVKLNPAEHKQAIWVSKQEALEIVNSYTNIHAILHHVPPKKDME